MSDTLRGVLGLVLILAGLHEPETDCPPQLDCSAMIVFSEARGEPIVGQVAVAEVVYQRGEPCDVMNAPGQFHGIRDWPVPRDPEAIDARAWRMALAASWIAQERLWQSECAGSTHFYAHEKVTPEWAGKPCVIAGHTFTIAANKQRAAAETWTLRGDASNPGKPLLQGLAVSYAKGE